MPPKQPGLMDMTGQAPLGQTAQQAQPQLAFTPPPSQQPGSDLLGVLSAIAGLGLNIAGAATQTGAAGNGTLQFANQQMDQSAKNKQAQQKYENNIKVGQAAYDQAKASNIPKVALDSIKAYAEAGDPDAAYRELDRSLSEMRRKDQLLKEERAYNFQEAQQGRQLSEMALKQHPHAMDAFLADFADGLKDTDTKGNILASLQTEARRQGLSINNEQAKKLAQQLDEARRAAIATRTDGGWLGLGINEKPTPKESHKTPGQVLRSTLLSEDGINDFKSTRQLSEQYGQAMQLLRAKPGSARYKQGQELLQQIQGGQPARQTQAPGVGQPAAPPVSDPLAGLKEVAKGSGPEAEKAKAYLKSKGIK